MIFAPDNVTRVKARCIHNNSSGIELSPLSHRGGFVTVELMLTDDVDARCTVWAKLNPAMFTHSGYHRARRIILRLVCECYECVFQTSGINFAAVNMFISVTSRGLAITRSRGPIVVVVNAPGSPVKHRSRTDTSRVKQSIFNDRDKVFIHIVVG